MLADHAQIEQAHLARLELGRAEAGLLMLEKIAGALEVDVEKLVSSR
jgi:transcriptional regulator with XRE-family HTH domain